MAKEGMKLAVMPDSYNRKTQRIPIRRPVSGVKPIYKIPIVKPPTAAM